HGSRPRSHTNRLCGLSRGFGCQDPVSLDRDLDRWPIHDSIDRSAGQRPDRFGEVHSARPGAAAQNTLDDSVLGGGGRSLKIKTSPAIFEKLGAEVVAGLGV